MVALLLLVALALPTQSAAAQPRVVDSQLIRGITIGPIESSLHPNKGYGSEPYVRTLQQTRRWGGTWISLTPFGRTMNLRPTGVDLTFESAFSDNRKAIVRAIAQAHRSGLRVMLVPHLWVESGEWRAQIDPGSDAGWNRWMDGYERFLLTWARVAQEAGAEMLSVGVELRSWVTSSRAWRFEQLIERVRKVYRGLLTYSANWDDADDTIVWGHLDVIGINAFYPLTDQPNASLDQLVAGGQRVAKQVQQLAETWKRPVLFTEIGYTTRPDPALRPWEWPDTMRDVVVDQQAQALAYEALLQPLIDLPSFAGFFVWRVYADPDDMSQEAEWGFSPRGKLAELVVRDAFAAYWAADGPYLPGSSLVRFAAMAPCFDGTPSAD